jgi:hypothetical protein
MKWFYKINEIGLCINRSEIYKITEDSNMPNRVKEQIQKILYTSPNAMAIS